MANEDSTSIKTIIEMDAVSHDEAYVLLERAHGVLDVRIARVVYRSKKKFLNFSYGVKLPIPA